MRNRIVTTLLVTVAITTVCLAQLKNGAVGLTVSFLENPNLGLAYAASQNTRISAKVGFNFAHDSTGNSSTYHFELNMWRYVMNVENVSGFFGGSVGMDALSNPAGTASSIGAGALYGMEYWFSARFAVHGTVQIHLSTGKALGSSVSRVFTTAESGLTWYL